jgi:hypothetical protein
VIRKLINVNKLQFIKKQMLRKIVKFSEAKMSNMKIKLKSLIRITVFVGTSLTLKDKFIGRSEKFGINFRRQN